MTKQKGGRNTKKKSTFRSAKLARGHRHSTSGSIMSPVDVRSPSQLNQMMDRIKKGPMTIVLVYADWCGHCHHFMPHFDAAAKNSGRSIQAVKINEKMMNEVNASLKKNNSSVKPINVDGYPSVLLVDKEGNEVTPIEPVKDTEVMTKVMNESGNMAKDAGLNNGKSSVEPDFVDNMGEEVGVSSTFNNTPVKEVKSVKNNNDVPPVNPRVNNMASLEAYATEQASLYSPSTSSTPSLMAPPSTNGDRESTAPMTGGSHGGSLYAALSHTAYQMAAPALLMGTAALLMRKNKRHTRRPTRKQMRRPTRKQQRRHK